MLGGLFALAGCFPRSVDISTQIGMHPAPNGGDSIDVVMTARSDTLRLAQGVISERNLVYRLPSGDSVVMRMWYPVGVPTDTSRLVVLVPAYGMSTLFLFALALETTSRGYPTAMLPQRGVADLNKHLSQSYGLKESEDLIAGLNSYQQRHAIQDLRVGLFGVSLGSVVALDVAATDRRVRAVAVEGMIDSLISTGERLMSEEEFAEVRGRFESERTRIDHLSPERSLRELRPVLLMARWGSKENLVTDEERERLTALIRERFPESDVAIVKGAGHVFRYGFPLSESEARAVNRSFADFLDRALRR